MNLNTTSINSTLSLAPYCSITHCGPRCRPIGAQDPPRRRRWTVGPAGKAKVQTYWDEHRGSEVSIGGKEDDMASIVNQGDIGKSSLCFHPLSLLLSFYILISHYIFTEAGSFLPIYKWQDRLVGYLNSCGLTHVQASTDEDPYPGNNLYTF
jgi:hypothetical protein